MTPKSCCVCDRSSSSPIFVKSGYELVQCDTCGLVYVSNPPTAAEISRIYSFESGYHVHYRDKYDHKRALDTKRPNFEYIRRYKSDGRLLDIGCSAGSFLLVAQENGWETCGLELSADTSAIARDRHGLDVRTGTLSEDTFEPNSFDVVTMWDVLEHFEDPARVVSLVNRILKDDGILAVTTPNIGGLFPKVTYRLTRWFGIRYWPHPTPPHHLYQFSKRSVIHLLETRGFTVTQIIDGQIPSVYVYGRFKSLLRQPKYLLYALAFIPLAVLGPFVRAGDWMVVIAKKRTPAATPTH